MANYGKVKIKDLPVLISDKSIYCEGGGRLLSDSIQPTGSIYISTNNVNPRTLFGGEWSQIDETLEVNGSVLTDEARATWISNASITLPQGRWLLIGSASGYGSGTGFTLQLSSRGAYTRQSVHCSDGNKYSGQVVDVIVASAPVTVYLQSWSATGRTLDSIGLKAFKIDVYNTSNYVWRRTV